MKRKETTKETTKKAAKGSIKKDETKGVMKSKFAIWWESYDPICEIVDMRAVLK
ncbi:MAG: hypothetical protein LBG96_16565 [Tannerella sp.]|jgi:hypothetical protein|nr:hypothetical protein [Tannerella sp.]